jgi:hypothetical protein
VMAPCSNVADSDPFSCTSTRDVGNPYDPPAPPWAP